MWLVTNRTYNIEQVYIDGSTLSIFLLAEFFPRSRRKCSLMLCSSRPNWIILSMAAWLPPHNCLLDWALSTSVYKAFNSFKMANWIHLQHNIIDQMIGSHITTLHIHTDHTGGKKNLCPLTTNLIADTQECTKRQSPGNLLTHICITILQLCPMCRAAIQKSIWRGFRHSVWEVINLHLHLSTARKSQQEITGLFCVLK